METVNTNNGLKFLKTFSIENFKKEKGVESLSAWNDKVHDRIYMSGDTQSGTRVFVGISKEIQENLKAGGKPAGNLKISEVVDNDGVVSFLLHKEGNSGIDFNL